MQSQYKVVASSHNKDLLQQHTERAWKLDVLNKGVLQFSKNAIHLKYDLNII